ncbi:alpha/beta fold hydrolase [Mycobacterium sp. SMC-4]|uniref:alpha/beta fold hydrolase n=1 Tax=Mycobacterium sp. SMC-4 TaxID=2857059 RepID=UPI0021B3B4B2|nr:alpha/beta fold hydrolase [Mycobacterium sp. SMC-4]
MRLVDDGYKNTGARQRYAEVYDRAWALSPPPDVVHDIATEFGNVRVYRHGPEHGVPIVLIHGFFLTSAMWWAQVEELRGDFTTYAMDMLGQPGASLQRKKMSTPADAARTIDAVLEGLDLHGVHLVGHSYGGWLATHTTAYLPGRLASLTLVDPAPTVVRLSTRFWRSLALLLSTPRSEPARRAAAWVTGHPAPGTPVDLLTKLFVAGFDSFAAPLNTPPLRFCGNRLLRSIDVPVQVLLAGNSVHDSRSAIRRSNGRAFLAASAVAQRFTLVAGRRASRCQRVSSWVHDEALTLGLTRRPGCSLRYI